MDALTLLEPHIEIEKVMDYYGFDAMREDGSMVRSCCKIHGGDNPSAFVARTDNNLWFCHTGGCGGGDVYTLVQKLEHVDFPTAVRKVASILHIDIGELQIAERQQSYLSEMKHWVKAMKGRIKKKQNDAYRITEEIRSVTKFRDFLPSTLEHFELGYVSRVELNKRDSDDTYILENRLLFPIIQNGIRIGASFRRVKNSDVPKWSHQPPNLETRNILYNYDSAKNNPLIVIVEGIVDVWAYYEIGVDAVATFGAHITEEQYRLLMKTGADLVWSYDGDEAGQKATKKALSLFHLKAKQYVVDFADGEDPANIPREELRARYDGKRKSP